MINSSFGRKTNVFSAGCNTGACQLKEVNSDGAATAGRTAGLGAAGAAGAAGAPGLGAIPENKPSIA